MSRLTIHDIRVVPSQPVAMSPSSVKQGIQVFELPNAEQEEMVAIVARVFESRAKSLVSELESFRDMKEEPESDRAPASLKRYQPAVDEKEEEFTMKILRRRLYQDDESVQKKVEGQKDQVRTPASEPEAMGDTAIQDRAKKRMDHKKSAESVRVMKEISNLDTSED
jgi:methyl coenzyme M reductase gamma subunit